MRNQQAKPTEVFYAVQRANRQLQHQLKQLESLTASQALVMQRVCQWLRDNKVAEPVLTDRQIIDKILGIEEEAKPETTGENNAEATGT